MNVSLIFDNAMLNERANRRKQVESQQIDTNEASLLLTIPASLSRLQRILETIVQRMKIGILTQGELFIHKGLPKHKVFVLVGFPA